MDGVIPLTRKQFRDQAERQAQEVLNVSFEEALKLFDQGKYRGTMIEGELRDIQYILERD